MRHFRQKNHKAKTEPLTTHDHGWGSERIGYFTNHERGSSGARQGPTKGDPVDAASIGHDRCFGNCMQIRVKQIGRLVFVICCCYQHQCLCQFTVKQWLRTKTANGRVARHCIRGFSRKPGSFYRHGVHGGCPNTVKFCMGVEIVRDVCWVTGFVGASIKNSGGKYSCWWINIQENNCL